MPVNNLQEILREQAELEKRATPGEWRYCRSWGHTKHSKLVIGTAPNPVNPGDLRMRRSANDIARAGKLWMSTLDCNWSNDAPYIIHLRNHAPEIREQVQELVEALKYYADGWHYRLNPDDPESTARKAANGFPVELFIETGDKARETLEKLGFG